MKHLITDIAVRFPAEGELIIELYTGKRSVGTVQFEAQPQRRADVPEEVDQPFTLYFPTAMQGLVLDLLRGGQEIEFDRGQGELRIGHARGGR